VEEQLLGAESLGIGGADEPERFGGDFPAFVVGKTSAPPGVQGGVFPAHFLTPEQPQEGGEVEFVSLGPGPDAGAEGIVHVRESGPHGVAEAPEVRGVECLLVAAESLDLEPRAFLPVGGGRDGIGEADAETSPGEKGVGDFLQAGDGLESLSFPEIERDSVDEGIACGPEVFLAQLPPNQLPAENADVPAPVGHGGQAEGEECSPRGAAPVLPEGPGAVFEDVPGDILFREKEAPQKRVLDAADAGGTVGGEDVLGDPEENGGLRPGLDTLGGVEVHFVPVEVGIIGAGHAGVDADGVPGDDLGLVGHEGPGVEGGLAVEQENVPVADVAVDDHPDLEGGGGDAQVVAAPSLAHIGGVPVGDDLLHPFFIPESHLEGHGEGAGDLLGHAHLVRPETVVAHDDGAGRLVHPLPHEVSSGVRCKYPTM